MPSLTGPRTQKLNGISLESLPNGETERGLGFEIVQTTRIQTEFLQQRQHLGLVNLGWQGVLQQCQFARIDIVRRRNNFGVQPVEIVGVVDTERRLDDGKLNAELDAGRTAEPEVSAIGNGQLTADVGARELLQKIGESLRIQLERVGTDDAVGAAVEEEGNSDGPD